MATRLTPEERAERRVWDYWTSPAGQAVLGSGYGTVGQAPALERDRKLFRGQSPVDLLFLKMLRHRSSLLTSEADWAPYCDTPVRVCRSERARPGKPGKEILMNVPCRKCAKCLQFRQMKWRERVLAEISYARLRTWNDTLTFSPIHWAGVLSEAALLPEHLPGHVREERAAYRHLQLYFKRLRAKGNLFRYVAFFERKGKDGEEVRAHYHVLVHEDGRPVLKRSLENGWRSIQQPRLVNQDAYEGLASYLTKYLTKDLSTRPRASLDYGKLKLLPVNRDYQTSLKAMSAQDAQEENLLGTSVKGVSYDKGETRSEF